jgi:uncharacterized protein YwgA
MKDTFSNLCEVWNEIGPFDMGRFSDRLILQKKIFLLQELGTDLGYNFSLYKRGPYCKELTSDGYKVNTVMAISSSNKSIEVIKSISKNHENDMYWFELLATIVYIYNKEGKKNVDEIKLRLLELKPYLSDKKAFEEAFAILKENGYLN